MPKKRESTARSSSTSRTPPTPNTWDRLATPPGSSSAEEDAQLVPQGTPVVKAFNTTFAPTVLPGEVDGQQLDLLIAADDDDAKQKVSHAVDEEVLSPVARAEEAVGNPIFEIVNGIRDVISPVHELARSFAEETLGEAYSEPAQDVGDYIAYVKSQGA